MTGVALVRDAIDFILASYEESGMPQRAEHPLEVATLLAEVGARADVVATAVLHDMVEDTGASAADVQRRFGPRIAALRAAERDGKTLEPEKLKHYSRSSRMLASGRPRPAYADELADRLRQRAAGSPTPSGRGEQLAAAARAAAARSAELGSETQAVLAQARQAVGRAPHITRGAHAGAQLRTDAGPAL